MLTYTGLLNCCEWESRPCHEYMHGLDTFQSFGRPVCDSSNFKADVLKQEKPELPVGKSSMRCLDTFQSFG